jgi:hypothetical protein
MNSWMLFSKPAGGIIVENKLNASVFRFCDSVYTKEFELILSNITLCYLKLRSENKQVPLKKENGIRDLLLNDYLKNASIKSEFSLSDYLFDKETSEILTTGRVDIRIMPVNPFVSDEAYYIIECKRLDNKARRGTSGLNAKYIENGIQRFTSGFYSSYYKTNAMIAFVVESMNIHDNVDDINYLLENTFKHILTISLIRKENFIKNYEFHYSSSHQTKEGLIKLYHLMFYFS